MRRAILAAASVLVGLLMQGCNVDRYELEVKPKGEELEQKLTVYRIVDKGEGKPKETESLSEAELDKLRAFYKRDGKDGPGGRKIFTRLLKDAKPSANLRGGQARFLCYSSDLGNSSMYMESLNGEDDLAGALQRRLDSADHLADLILQWFSLELAIEPRTKDLLHWIANDFRKDLRNFSAYLWQIHCTNPLDESSEWRTRLFSYVLDHGYFTKDDIPRLGRAFQNLESAEGDRALFSWLQRFVARRMGIPDDKPVPESLAFLGSREKLVASMQQNIHKTKTYEILWRKETKGRLDLITPENPGNGLLLMYSLFESFDLFEAGPLHSHAYEFSVKLQAPAKPDWTNGEWEEKSKTVQWGLDSPGMKKASFVYAGWAEPSERQTARFGKVLLDGQRLAQYAVWFQALHEHERAEWTAFVDTIKPGDDLAKALESFRFKAEKALDEKEVKPGLSNAVRDIFREALAPVEAPPLAPEQQPQPEKP